MPLPTTHYIAVLLKEITIDPTALLPMLFAGDSQGSPCQLGSHTARLFLHQMARPTPSGCLTLPGRQGSDVYQPGFLCTKTRTAGSGITGQSRYTKNLCITKRCPNPSGEQCNKQGRKTCSVALTFTAHLTSIPAGLLGLRDTIVNKQVSCPQASYSLPACRLGDSITD